MSNIGDIDDMVKNALFILKDENLPGFKSRALKKAKEFDIKNVVPQYEAFYQKVIEKVALEQKD
jgi:hypothetical protein